MQRFSHGVETQNFASLRRGKPNHFTSIVKKKSSNKNNGVFAVKTLKTKIMTNELFKNRYRIPSTRAPWHDYRHGTYFVTICTKTREHSFGEIINDGFGDPIMRLSAIGDYADMCWREIPLHFPHVQTLSRGDHAQPSSRDFGHQSHFRDAKFCVSTTWAIATG